MADTATVEWLSAAITQAAKSAKFCVSGNFPAVAPGLVVEGLGPVKLPLSPRMVKPLLARCRVAPYGKGTETLVDRQVRNTCELNPEQFQLSAAWNEAIVQVVRSVAADFGLPPGRLEARLYKLLIYEKGGFFLSHRDSEKHDGMVATMVVALPNRFVDGKLLVRHGANEREFSFADAAAGKAACYAAFYADCEHEVKRVSRGRRICLTYNLVLKPQPGTSSSRTAPPTAVEALTESIQTWFAAQTAEPLVFALEHHYTEHGLSRDLLKGGDRQLADLIVPAAERAECAVYLSQVARHLLQFADDGGFAYGYRGYRAPRSREITVGEVYEDDLAGDQWADLDGQKQPWGSIAFNPAAIVSSIPLDRWTPTAEEFEGYTGNAGNTLDRWYHRSALVVWPRDRHFEVIAAAGAGNCIPLFCAMVAKLETTPPTRRERARNDCLQFARAIIGRWPQRYFHQYQSEAEKLFPADNFGQALLLLHDRDTIAAFLSVLAERDQKFDLDKLILTACREFGWSAFADELKQLISVGATPGRRNELMPRDIEWLAEFCCDTSPDPGKSALARKLCALAVDRFCEPFEPRSSYWAGYRPPSSTSETTLPALVRALLAIDDSPGLARLLTFVREHSHEFRLEECLIPALKVLIPWARKRLGSVPSPLESWLDAVRQTLESLTAAKPAPPADWVRPAEVECRCTYCAQLNAFLSDAANQVISIRAPEERRGHLIEEIGLHQCDVTHHVEKSTRPYALVLTKTTGSFDRALQQFHIHQQLLQELPPSTN